PCNVLNCEAKDVKFRRFTKDGLKNAKNHGTYEDYNYLEINDQLCPKHYLSIVQSSRNKSNNQKRKSQDFEDDNNIIEIDDIIEDVDTKTLNSNYLNYNWSNIDVDVQDDAVLLSRNDFDCLMNKIKEMQIKVNQYENNK
ncbi:22550_t:CDS:2, partial [Entrophospora sp. SA101]